MHEAESPQLRTIETIEIKPVFDDQAIQRYADEHLTVSPTEHISGRLEALAALAERVEEIEQTYRADKDRWHYLRDAVTVAHRKAGEDLFSFFGSRT